MAVKNQQIRGLTKMALRWRLISILVLAVVCSFVVFPGKINDGINWVNNKANLGLPNLPAKGFNLGLDLQGGAHLVYQAKTDQIADRDRAASVEGVRDVIERRVRGGLGVAEPMVQTTRVGSNYRVIVELPGVTDVNQAIKMIGETPILEFKEEDNSPARVLTTEEKKQLDAFNAAADKKVNAALKEVLKKDADFGKLADKYTEDPTSTVKNGDLGYITYDAYPELYDWAKTQKNGDISKTIIKSADGLNVVKMNGAQDGEKTATASHILICYSGADYCTSTLSKADAKKKVDEIKKEVTTANFSDLAKKYSTDTGSAANGGVLGTFVKGKMVPEFENTVFSMATGTISDPVESQYGYHLIYKTGEGMTKEYRVARIFVRTKKESDIVSPASEWKSTGLSGKQLKKAEVNQDYRSSQIQVSLKFDDAGTKLFADITQRNVGKPVAIYLDGSPISVPKVNEAITNGSAVITGQFTLTEAKLLAQRLNSGALPVAVELISQQKVDATLGSDSLSLSLYAGLIGFLAVILFMILYYRLPGLLAVLALSLYAALSLTIFKVIGVTLTLSGIAGFILSVGMAVDANVLIFERLKEELRMGRGLRSAMEESFIRAWPSIRDSNITTLISCVFLIWMGGGFVQGFAVTLSIGVLVSMFTAITVTRNIMRWVSPWFKEEGNWMFWGYTKRDNLLKK